MDTPTPVAVPAAIRAARDRFDGESRRIRLLGAAGVRGRDWAHGEARRRQNNGRSLDESWPYTVSDARMRVVDMANSEAEVHQFAEAMHLAAIERWAMLRREL